MTMIKNLDEFETALRRLNTICDVPFRIEILEDELLEYVKGLEQALINKSFEYSKNKKRLINMLEEIKRS